MKRTLVFLLTILMVAPAVLTIWEDRSQNTAYIYGIPANARFSYTSIPMEKCSWCHRTVNLNRHHIVPQSADITLRDEPTNIVVLCRDCHFVLGHKCNWKQFNPDVMEIVNTYTNVIVSKEYNNQIANR